MKNGVTMKGDMGERLTLKENAIVNVVGYNVDKDGDPYIVIKYNDEVYNIDKNDYFYFKYWFEPT